MPANLTPDYERQEQRYRAATTDDERLDALRAMFSTIPKHKGTEKLQADIKRRISLLRKAAAKRPSKGPDPFYVPHTGAGQIVLVGTPNCGKSALVGAVTKAPVKVTDYPFATALPVPGMWHFNDVQLELVDTPPVTAEHVPPGLMGTIRHGDIIAVVVDASADPLEEADTVLELFRQREMRVHTALLSELDPSDPADLCGIIVATKSDRAEAGAVDTLRQLYEGRLDVVAVSATMGTGLDALGQKLWGLLAQIRVYTKEPGEEADMHKPFTLPAGATVEDLAEHIHRELPGKMRFARVWGQTRFQGMQVHRTEELHDRDVVEIHQ